MGQRATGLATRLAMPFDALTVLVGSVLRGTRGRVAETRTGAAQLLNTSLNHADVYRIVASGSSSSAGTYTIQAAHVPEGGALASASTYATIAVITCAPGIQRIAIQGDTVERLVRTAGSLTGDVSVRAVRAVAGTDANAPAGTNTIRIVPIHG
jgi:hypothetical protein